MAGTSRRGCLLFATVFVTCLVGTILYIPYRGTAPNTITQQGFYKIIYENSDTTLSHRIVQENTSTTEIPADVTAEIYELSTTKHSGESATTVQTSLAVTTQDQKLSTEPPTATPTRSAPKVKLILGYTKWWGEWSRDFTKCKHKCRLSIDKSLTSQADMLLFEMKHAKKVEIPKISPRQYKVLIDMESSAFGYNRFKSQWDGQFNITMTFRRGSTIQHSIYGRDVIKREIPLNATNYSAGKTMDMIAYVSNCISKGYDRIGLMKELGSRGLSLDLYGKCGKPDSQDNKDSSHKFRLSFENSLCEDYITEKFWNVLSSDEYLIPVVMGGKSVDDYLRVAPPDSFIHVENFTSIDDLAKHLKSVSSDSELFNKYHKWREQYQLVPASKGNRGLAFCELCDIAHEERPLPARTDLSQWWNEGACKTAHLTQHSKI